MRSNPPMDSVDTLDLLIVFPDDLLLTQIGLAGQVLLVLAIEMPLVAVKVMTGPHVGKRIPMDLRNCKWRKVSPEYYAALVPELPFQKGGPTDGPETL